MKQPLITPRLIVFAILFALAAFTFRLISSYGYFERTTEAPHIIDAHLMPGPPDRSFQDYSKRFFDSAYVRQAARHYNPNKYMHSYFILDLLFPFIYYCFFLALAGYWKGSTFYSVLRWAMVAVVLLDLAENTAFAYFLFHQEGNMHQFVAVFTTLKSVLFCLGMFAAAISFGVAGVNRLKK
ncbi:hypothetical protein [Chitinophaga barathri]|nr:hypothetical protein [Chitinophaga barathri]